MRKIAITGTMAAGKTEVSLWLRRHGQPVFDADGYSHMCLHRNHPAWPQIIAAFGEQILDDSGEIDRARLAELVFADPAGLARLNGIIHPYVKAGLLKNMASAQRPLYFAEIPLLYEAGWQDLFDEVAVVTCARQTAIERCMKYRGYTRQQAIARLARQTDPQQQIAQAAKVFYNDGTLAQFDRQISQWFAQLKKGNSDGTEAKR